MLRFINFLFGWNSKTLNKTECKELVCFIEKAGNTSPKQQIIEYDKIYHHTLKKLSYYGSFWEILKIRPKEIKNIEEIWELHKLRNSLVHELKNRDEKFLESQAIRYEKIIKKFVKQVTK